MRLRPLFIASLCSCFLLALAADRSSAGSWTIAAGTVTAGSATTSTSPATVNSHTFFAGQTYPLPSSPPFLNLSTAIPVPWGSASNTATADGVIVHFVLTWVPDAGKDLTTDPPPATINVVATLGYSQSCHMDTTVTNAVFHGISGVFGDGISIPDLILDATATATKNASGTIKKSHNLGVNTVNGVATAVLDIPLTAKNQFNITLPQRQGSNGNVNITAQITPTVSVRDVVSTVPDPTIFPKKGNPANKYTFGGDAANILDNPAWVATFIGVSDPTPYLNGTTFTSFDVGASVKVAGDKQVAGNTITQQFTYTGLPKNNSDFGIKQVTLTVASADINTTQSATVQVFFTKAFHDHPGPDLPTTSNIGESSTPNWYFYWSQIQNVAVGTHTYGGGAVPALHSGLTYFSTTGDTNFNPPLNNWVVLIGSTAAGGPAQINGWGNADGIDFFAWVCRHEDRHLQDNIGFWGQHKSGYNAKTGAYDKDADGDYLPDDMEQQLGMPYHPETNGYNNTMFATPMDHYNYGPGWSDTEDYCLHRQDQWKNGDADTQDWANPGHQF